jgi:hypothetical protein
MARCRRRRIEGVANLGVHSGVADLRFHQAMHHNAKQKPDHISLKKEVF